MLRSLRLQVYAHSRRPFGKTRLMSTDTTAAKMTFGDLLWCWRMRWKWLLE